MRARARHPGLYDSSGNALPHRLVDVDGVSTYVVDAGEGRPVLLVHGYGDTADGWRRVVPGLLRADGARAGHRDRPLAGRGDLSAPVAVASRPGRAAGADRARRGGQ